MLEEKVDQPETTGPVVEAPAEAAAETQEASAINGDNGQAAQQGTQQAPEGQEDFIGETPKELEPLKKELLTKFYAKTRELAKERQEITKVQKDAETLQNLMNYKPFQEWYNTQKTGGTTSTQETLTEEYMEQLRSDPAKFSEFLNKKLETLVEQKYGAQMKTVQEKAEDMEVAKEF